MVNFFRNVNNIYKRVTRTLTLTLALTIILALLPRQYHSRTPLLITPLSYQNLPETLPSLCGLHRTPHFFPVRVVIAQRVYVFGKPVTVR